MAKNDYGFVCKRYRQPYKYDLIFSKYNAVYHTKNGREVMIEAVPHFLAMLRPGLDVDHYDVLIREPDCRRVIRSGLKSQKAAIEIIEKLIEKY